MVTELYNNCIAPISLQSKKCHQKCMADFDAIIHDDFIELYFIELYTFRGGGGDFPIGRMH